jgi:peptidoglycan/LPS O-acetylase OafA/YrhL
VLAWDNGDYSSGAFPSAAPRLPPVDGLRAYLALWVLAIHVLWASGYQGKALAGYPELIRLGPYAVELFMIISGFVIVLSLNIQRQTYLQFIVRRFFRLFPVFIILFVVAIPLSRVSLWNVTHASQYVTPDQIENRIGNLESWWENIQWNIPLHVLMLHGLVPEALIKDGPSAFLIPAWSVSLEWQFYLIAPLAYIWTISSRPYRRLCLCALCLVLVPAARRVFPYVQYGAALPFHVEFFFLGAASYFIYMYQRQVAHQLSDTAFPIACCLAVLLFNLSGRAWSLIPIVLWIAVLGLLLEHPSSFSSRLVSPLLTNPFMLYLGRISYSLYLSHMLVMIVIQYALLTWAPHLSRMVHFVLLLTCTTAATISVSALLHRCLEAPGIRVGRSLARRLAPKQAVSQQDAMFHAPWTGLYPPSSGQITR